jgi:hypothetical protein
MKKLILVVGILTQSYFGISQKIEKIKEYPLYNNDTHFTFSVISLTHDNNYIYGLSYNPNNYIIKYNPKTFEVVDVLEINFPELLRDELGCNRVAEGLTYDGKYLWVAYAAKQKIFKLNKYTGKVLGSIPGPPITKFCHKYNGLDFDGRNFWIIRNDDDSNIDLFKLSKSGKILDERKIDSINTSSLGLHHSNKHLWTCLHNVGKTVKLSKYSISDSSFVESYPIPYYKNNQTPHPFRPGEFGVPNGITIFNNNLYFVGGGRGISKVKLIKE